MDTTPQDLVFYEYVVQAMIAYVVFVLTSSSLGLWLTASLFRTKWKAYTISSTFALAVIVIVRYTPIERWVAAVSLLISVVGPLWYNWRAYHRRS